jgi:hypothetical protein
MKHFTKGSVLQIFAANRENNSKNRLSILNIFKQGNNSYSDIWTVGKELLACLNWAHGLQVTGFFHTPLTLFRQ